MGKMKKYNKIYSFLILALFLSLISINAHADEKVYSIDKITIDVNINEFGDLNVEERYDYNFQGDFNGIRRSINTDKSQGIKNITVGEILKTNEDKLVKFNNNASGEDGTYEVTKEESMEKIKIFSKTSNATKRFYIKYTILGAVTKYNDIGELYWKFYENTANVNISNVEVKVNFLNSKFNSNSQGETSNSNEIKFWGIGPSSGNSERVDNSTFRFNIDSLSSDEFIGCRIIFPEEYLKSARNIVSEDAYDRIVNEQLEQSNQEQNNDNYNNTEGYQSQPPIYENYNGSYSGEFDNESNIGGTIGVILGLGGIAGVVFLSIRKREEFNKALEEYRSNYTFFNEKYYDKLPSNVSPALVSLLVNRDVEIKDIMASLINLSTRGLLKCNTHKYVETHFIARDEEKVDYEFIIIENRLQELSSHENHLVYWLASYGFGNSFRLSQIEAQAQDRVSARNFQTNYDIWVSLVKEEAENLGFYVMIKNKTKLSNEFHNEYLMWEGFKRYLNEYDDANTSNLVEDDFWDNITAYAISLDLTDSIIKYSPVYREGNYHNHYPNHVFYNVMYLNDFCHDFNSNLYRHTHDNNSGSSGFSSGDGGSFTGGGDSFDGGGGGGSDAF